MIVAEVIALPMSVAEAEVMLLKCRRCRVGLQKLAPHRWNALPATEEVLLVRMKGMARSLQQITRKNEIYERSERR